TRSLVGAEDEYAGGHRVEGAGMADLAGAGQLAHARHHPVRGDASGLVDDDQPGDGRFRDAHASSSPTSVSVSSSAALSSTRGLRYGSPSEAYVAPSR